MVGRAGGRKGEVSWDILRRLEMPRLGPTVPDGTNRGILQHGVHTMDYALTHATQRCT